MCFSHWCVYVLLCNVMGYVQYCCNVIVVGMVWLVMFCLLSLWLSSHLWHSCWVQDKFTYISCITFLRWPNLNLKISSCSWYSACVNLQGNRSNLSTTSNMHTTGKKRWQKKKKRKKHHTFHSLLRWSCFYVCFAPDLEAESEPWRAACAWPAASSAVRCLLVVSWSFLVAWKEDGTLHLHHIQTKCIILS